MRHFQKHMALLAAGIAFTLHIATAVMADDVLAYGEYLAGECTACHSPSGIDKGIPSIVGWDAESFIKTLQFYKSGERDNPVMVDVAKNLDDEMMMALAAYFATLADKSANGSGN